MVIRSTPELKKEDKEDSDVEEGEEEEEDTTEEVWVTGIDVADAEAESEEE